MKRLLLLVALASAGGCVYPGELRRVAEHARIFAARAAATHPGDPDAAAAATATAAVAAHVGPPAEPVEATATALLADVAALAEKSSTRAAAVAVAKETARATVSWVWGALLAGVVGVAAGPRVVALVRSGAQAARTWAKGRGVPDPVVDKLEDAVKGGLDRAQRG